VAPSQYSNNKHTY